MDENPQNAPIVSEPVAPTPATPEPQFQPTEPAKPAPKIPKNQLILIISLAVLALAGVCFGVYGIIKANSNNSAPTPTPTPSTPSDNTPVTVTKTTDEKVQDIIDKISSKIESETIYTTAANNGGNGSKLIGIAGSNVFTDADRAYGITISSVSYEDESEVSAVINSVLTSNGYTFVKEKILPGTSENIYYNATDGIYCTTHPTVVNCNSEDWADEADKELVVALSKAIPGEDTINASVDNIKNSPIAPYQKITAGITDAAGLFYRVSPDSDWVFFKGTQAVLPCSDYTGDAAKAFAGEQCEGVNGLSTVQP